ncbi:ATP-binding protein [Hyalangium gracile]|uniref:ATP-binding protein n=1 Tax=Hyalangium gracile TaxID=394092 RepID=UPI0021E14463|nr:ATP-binding protein [Hyalangium gracile]
MLELQAELAALATRGEMEAVMRLIATRGQELSGGAGAAVALIEEGEIVCRAGTGSVARAVGERMQLEGTLTSQSMASRQAMRCDDTELDTRVDRATCRRMGARSLVVTPLVFGERPGALLFALSPRPNAFGEVEERRVSLLARSAGPLLALAQASKVAVERERELWALKEMMRRRDAELEVVIQSIEEPAYLVGEGGAVRANRAALELLGADSALGLRGHPVLLAERLQPRSPETQAPVGLDEDPLARALTGQPWTRELVVRHTRAGMDVRVRTSGAPVRVDGKVVAAVVVHTDVGARRRVEEQKDQFLTLVERSTECIGITTLTGRPVYLNPAGRGLLGFESQEAFRASAVLETYLPEDREAARVAFTAVRERGHWEGELRLRDRRTGEAIPVWHQLFTLVARETGRPVGLGSVTRDLREPLRAEAVRERLIDIVSNDLREPLSAIAVAASTLLRRGELSEADTKAAGRIAQSAERMGRLMGQVLDFTRTYLGAGLVLLPTRMDLDVVAQDVVAAAELEHPDRLVRYVKRGDASGLWDRERLVELLSMLLGHALRGSPAERPVDLRLKGEGEEVVVEVSRTGAPIPAEVLPQLFDAFRSSPVDEARREHEGLGLFLAREIARAHGGDVEVRSSAAEGTTFRVRLPRGAATVD